MLAIGVQSSFEYQMGLYIYGDTSELQNKGMTSS